MSLLRRHKLGERPALRHQRKVTRLEDQFSQERRTGLKASESLRCITQSKPARV